MLELVSGLWPLTIPILVAAMAGDLVMRRRGKTALWIAMFATLVVCVAIGTLIGVRDFQPVLSQIVAALVLYAVPLTGVALVLEFAVRKQWRPLPAVTASFLTGALCLLPLSILAILAQGALGGDSF